MKLNPLTNQMNHKTILPRIVAFCLLAVIAGCKEKAATKTEVVDKQETIGVFNFDNKEEFSEYMSLNLDESHPNLLNPEISKSDYKSVIESWTGLHQRIGAFLEENKFTWGVPDDAIRIVHKIYFGRNGRIENYFFRIANEEVSKEKKEEFANLIAAFARTHRMDLQMDHSFAQCGKTKYMNK